ncbi:hypothetical protein [Hansschlegelia zhihuaiae]|uniref:Uncharacterized protein n=1 Tax=Hansschlegelia zhihuaiae TaxID=405005 RepID=A0A4Q0M9L3_9HYPH|nr:hypothetical protein [Hansschlegelia zhihuaiae]RXF69900.1 hypothetical protein EK403_18165 [Hansschlegelia zhihuaiae]
MPDANLLAAMTLVQKMQVITDLHQHGVKLTRAQMRRYLGCYAEDAFDRIEDLTSHITFTGPDGEPIATAMPRH